MPISSGSSSSSKKRIDNNAEAFISFFETWLVRQEHYLDELISVEKHCHESKEDDLKELISRILAHYEEYYKEKSRIAQHNIFLVFSPPCFSSFEHTFLWAAGFKPGLAFRVLNGSVHDLSEEQVSRINMLKQETKVSERVLNDELAKLQESVASPPLVDAVRRRGRVVLGEERATGSDKSAVDRLGAEMEAVVARGDLLRTNTVMKVVEILTPVQNVKFLLAVAQLQLKTRKMGSQFADAGKIKNG
ncbi:protein ZW2-like [Mercurialis annua]|uniref:protein ZW2-like n=1 Tax=Mercurialis annua TaxID=3986 RepID=UPI0024AF2224|nr:protein ZW2-like [Mercurialis annua]